MSLSRREMLKLSGLLPLFGARSPYFFGAPSQPAKNPNSPNILILLFDTLSAYHVSLFGYRRDTMPNLARFADRATVYHNHYSTGNYTTPGTASLLTGTYPWTHRAFMIDRTVAPAFENRNLFSLFDNYYRSCYTHNPFADVFLRQFRPHVESYLPLQSLYLGGGDFWVGNLLINDFDTASLSRSMGIYRDDGLAYSLFLSRFFQWLEENREKHVEQAYGPQFPLGVPYFLLTGTFILEDAIDWIATKLTNPPKPFLSYFHMFPPHAPYRTRSEFVSVFDDGWLPVEKPYHVFSNKNNSQDYLTRLRREYDEYILYVDAEFGRLLDSLETAGTLDDTLVIFTSDHGEMFERGIRGHAGKTLHQPLIRVPLLISQPRQDQRRDIYGNTSSIDLLPTLLHLTGQARPAWLEGQILPPWREQPPSGDRPIFAMDAKSNGKYKPITRATAAIVKGNHQLSYYFGYTDVEPFTELYDVQNDPEELHDLANPGLREALLQELLEKIDEVNEPYRG